MKKEDFVLMLVALVIFAAILFAAQQKQIQQLNASLAGVNQKADQGNLAARMALKQSTELVEGIQNLAQTEVQERTPIGFRIGENKEG
ncbi:hypothetical protein [Halocola ammonii]